MSRRRSAVPAAANGDGGRPLRVVVSNSVILNGGDAAIVEATLASLERATGRPLTVTVLDRQHEVAARLHPSLQFAPWPWQVFFPRGRGRIAGLLGRTVTRGRAYAAAYLLGRGAGPLARPLLRGREWELLRLYAQADLVVAKGGTYLVEIYELAPHFFDLRLCLLLRRPLVLGAQSLGPFRRPRVRRALRRILPRARLVLLRDERSLEHLRAIGVDTANVEVVADAAFALADPLTLAGARGRGLGRPLRVALSVREWRHFRTTDPASGRERYAESVCSLATRLVRRHGAELTFVSTCQGVPEYWADDSRLARELVDRLPADVAAATSVDASHHPPEELRRMLSSFDLAVSTRMHFAILALTAGVPVLPIAYEFKTTALFERLGLGVAALEIDSIDPESAVRTLDRFLATLPARRARLFERVEEERRTALEAAALVAAAVPGAAGADAPAAADAWSRAG